MSLVVSLDVQFRCLLRSIIMVLNYEVFKAVLKLCDQTRGYQQAAGNERTNLIFKVAYFETFIAAFRRSKIRLFKKSFCIFSRSYFPGGVKPCSDSYSKSITFSVKYFVLNLDPHRTSICCQILLGDESRTRMFSSDDDQSRVYKRCSMFRKRDCLVVFWRVSHNHPDSRLQTDVYLQHPRLKKGVPRYFFFLTVAD